MLSSQLRGMDSSSGEGGEKKPKSCVETGRRVVLNSFVLIETLPHPL